MLEIRYETPDDYASVYRVNHLAFKQPSEAKLVDRLRNTLHPCISLVASKDSAIVGHILFTPVSVENSHGKFAALALGPMAVLPEWQNQGIGSSLVRRGVEVCLQSGQNIVFVLGHPIFYPRFGFVPAKAKGFFCEWTVPDDVFMVAELVSGALQNRSGLVKYHPEFSKL